MEILIKITDINPPTETTGGTANIAIAEASQILQDDAKRIETLLTKGRKKIDLVGTGCNLEISVKD